MMQAIVLAAGYGSRLNGVAASKPLAVVAGKPLLLHVLSRLADAGIEEAIVVVGHLAEAVEAAIAGWALPLPACTVRADPVLPNGSSILAAAPLVGARTLLVMADHLVDPGLYRRVAAASARPGEVLLGVDRRLEHPWIDADDVTRVQTDAGRIVRLGKSIASYDAYDTGVFSVDAGLFDALAALRAPSLSEGVSALAAAGQARVVETGDSDWIDVDDPRALAIAEQWLAAMKPRVSA